MKNSNLERIRLSRKTKKELVNLILSSKEPLTENERELLYEDNLKFSYQFYSNYNSGREAAHVASLFNQSVGEVLYYGVGKTVAEAERNAFTEWSLSDRQGEADIIKSLKESNKKLREELNKFYEKDKR